jgi:hypothetical protein
MYDLMPNRTTLNKYELLITDVRRLAKRKEIEDNDFQTKKKAMLVAALSSNHSWKTYKYLHDGGNFDRDGIISEAIAAFNEGWKNITETDVEEVVNSNIDEHMFSMWLFEIVNKEQRQEFWTLLNNLKVEFADGLEPIERVLD